MFVSEAKPKKMRQSSKTIEAREPSEASEINESENPGNNIIDAAVIELRNYMESVRDIMCNACLAIISEIPVSTELLSRIDDNTPQKTTEERVLIEVIGLLVSLIDRMLIDNIIFSKRLQLSDKEPNFC